MQYHYLLKFIVIGDTGVGKSCVVQQFIEQKIILQHEVTLGVQFATRQLKVNEKMLKLQIWDTAGQQNFRSITRSYYRSAIGTLLIYDITRRDTFEHLQDWLEEVNNNGSANMEIILVGNKNDLESERQVTFQEGQMFATKMSLYFVQINAKNYKKVQNAFLCLCSRILSKISKGIIDERSMGIKFGNALQKEINNKSSVSKNQCC